MSPCDKMDSSMSNDYVTVRNLVTRKVGKVRRRIADHPVFGLHLEIVPEGSKSYVDLDELVKESLPEPTPVEAEAEGAFDEDGIDYDEKEDEA